MKVSVLIVLTGIILSPFCIVGQTISDSVATKNKNAPIVIFDFSYSEKFMFFNSNSAVKFTNGDIALKLHDDFELNVMALLDKDSKNQHNHFYGGAGINFSQYNVKRTIYYDGSYSGHFPMTYSYNPDGLYYTLQLLRFQWQLGHYALYKKLMIFQKIGLAYTSFMKNNSLASHYTEKYGNSVPQQDPAYITPANPEGWYFHDNYTYTDKNDMDIYKSSITAFYKFGIGVRIKRFTPFMAFEFSNVTGKFWSPYLKFQIGVNYSILPK